MVQLLCTMWWWCGQERHSHFHSQTARVIPPWALPFPLIHSYLGVHPLKQHSQKENMTLFLEGVWVCLSAPPPPILTGAFRLKLKRKANRKATGLVFPTHRVPYASRRCQETPWLPPHSPGAWFSPPCGRRGTGLWCSAALWVLVAQAAESGSITHHVPPSPRR